MAVKAATASADYWTSHPVTNASSVASCQRVNAAVACMRESAAVQGLHAVRVHRKPLIARSVAAVNAALL